MEFTEETDDIDKYSNEELEEIKDKIKGYYEIIKTNGGIASNNNKELLKNITNEFDKGCFITGLIMCDVDEKYSDNIELSEKTRNGYLERPPFLFYTCKSGLAIRRVIGIGQRENGEMIAEAVTGMIMFNNRIVGGIELDELVPVKTWNESQLNRLNTGLIRPKEAFTKVLGFMIFSE
jgi:hypothetical protein